MLNILLAVVWALLSGEVSLRELTIGFLIGFALLGLVPDALGARQYRHTSFALLRFVWGFARELTVANIHVAMLALQLKPRLNAMIFKVSLQPHNDLSLTMLVASVTLMPGSVVLGFSRDQREMYVHAIGLANTHEATASVKRIENALLAFLQPSLPATSLPEQPASQEVTP